MNRFLRLCLSDNNLAVGGLLDVLINGDAPDGIGRDAPADGVLDLGDGTADRGVDIAAILESTVASGVEGAVLEGEAIDVAEGLLAGDMTAHETQVLGVPTDVLAIEMGIVDGDVLGP